MYHNYKEVIYETYLDDDYPMRLFTDGTVLFCQGTCKSQTI